MQLVDRHRLVHVLLRRPGRHPVGVAPLVGRLEHLRRGVRRHLGVAGHRVGLLTPLAVGAEHDVLVGVAGADPGHEQLPDTGVPELAHRVLAAVPAVEVRLEPDGARGRGPHRERRAGDRVPEGGVVVVHPRPEHGPQQLVPALVDQVQVHLAERRQEPVRVVDRVGMAVVVGHLEAVVGHVRARQHADPDALVLVGQLVRRPVAVPDGDPLGQRLEGADGHAAVVRVRAEDRVRAAVLAPHEQLELVDGDGLDGRLGPTLGRARHAAPILATAWSGIVTHDGRLRVS